MIREIQAKTILNKVKQPDAYFGLTYNMNLYRGCQHQCIYCDSRSECYRIENFADILVKANAIDLLKEELPRKRVKGTIGTGSMNDPYMPVEMKYNLTGRALQVIADHHFPVHIITKSDLVLRDVSVLQQISQTYAAVTFTITTADDELSKKLEPGAPVSSARFKAMETLASHALLTGVTLMPILPFLEDDPQNITAMVHRAKESGATYIIPGFGVTLRDRQRAYYYDKLDKNFPGLRQKYIHQFGGRYFAPVQTIEVLSALFHSLCEEHGMAARMPFYHPEEATQMKLL